MVDKAPGFELRSPESKLPLWEKRVEFMNKLREFPLMNRLREVNNTSDVGRSNTETECRMSNLHTNQGELTENWDKNDTRVLFVTEGIIMRQALGHDDENHANSILETRKF